jgi:hypothetical protein
MTGITEQEPTVTRTGQHRIEAFWMSIMGPAELGEDKAPDGYVADAAAELCNKCGRPWDGHPRLHKDNITYLQCPDPA